MRKRAAIEGHPFVLMRAFVQFNYELYADYDVLVHIKQEELCTATQRRQMSYTTPIIQTHSVGHIAYKYR